jgi:hypothetical protein
VRFSPDSVAGCNRNPKQISERFKPAKTLMIIQSDDDLIFDPGRFEVQIPADPHIRLLLVQVWSSFGYAASCLQRKHPRPFLPNARTPES